jgi:starvation-inducible DNA-binding protein
MPHKIQIGLDQAQREGVVALLNSLLADEYVLYTKTRNFHWNVIGPRFHDLHKFFEGQYGEIDGIIDEVAERSRSLGAVAPGSMAEFLKSARLKEQAGAFMDADAMVAALLHDHEALIRHLREDLDAAQAKFGDAGTADFLTGIMETHEKMAWMLRALLG